MTNKQIRLVAQRFADALDQNDFDTVAALLSPHCVYVTHSEGTFTGPEAIAASYRSHDALARKLFDRVEYSSTIEGVDGSSAAIRFYDVLEKDGARHSYYCRQHVHVSDAGKIDSITHEEVPSEADAFRVFLRRVGVVIERES
jgi:hypothetical protein